MIIDKIIIAFLSFILIIALMIRYIKRYAPENMVIIPLATFFLTLYISFTFYDINIPIYMQAIVNFFTVVLPAIAVYLQYNNIILSRKILYFRMKLFYKAENYKKTIEYIEKIVLLEGRRSKTMYILGKCYKAIGDFINARDSFALAVELDEKDYVSYYELGLILDETNKKEKALEMYKESVRIKRDYYEANEAIGINLTSQGKFEEAIAFYKGMLKNFPNSYEVYYNIAMLESEIGRYDDAILDFEMAGKIKPDLYMANYNLGKLYFSKCEFEKAIDAYTKILMSTTYGKKGYYQIAICYARIEEYAKAITFLEYAMELDVKYVIKADREYAFNPIRNLIEDYKRAKEKERIEKMQRRNFMNQKIKMFTKKDSNVIDFKERILEKKSKNCIEVEKVKDNNISQNTNNDDLSNSIRNHA